MNLFSHRVENFAVQHQALDILTLKVRRRPNRRNLSQD